VTGRGTGCACLRGGAFMAIKSSVRVILRDTGFYAGGIVRKKWKTKTGTARCCTRFCLGIKFSFPCWPRWCRQRERLRCERHS
jgi:hypothetical protein